MRRTLVTVAMAAFLLLIAAPPAGAHSVSGVNATNYRTRLQAVEPAVEGLRIRVIETGSRLELTNDTPVEAIVFGYEKDPYLRVGPDGVFENVKSPAVSINASRGGGILSPDADPDAPPEWRKISSGHVARWHDHRIHFMGTQDPPTVRRAPDKQHVITPEWIVPIRYDTTDINARGDLVWVPGPSPVPWLLLAFATLAVLVVAALLAPARLRTILLVALAGLVVVDLIHGAGIALAGAGPFSSQISRYVTASLFSLLGWAAAVAAFVLVARGSEDGVYLAGFSGIFIALFGGFTDIADLSRSQVPFAWSAGLVRVLVSLTLGLGFGILGLAVLSALRGPRALGARGVAEAGA